MILDGVLLLNYLKEFSEETIKIDKSFVEGLPKNKNNKSIVKAIIALSHCLGIKVVAEGVETKEQLKCLADAGCDEIQGYYYSKPLPPTEISLFLKTPKKLIK